MPETLISLERAMKKYFLYIAIMTIIIVVIFSCRKAFDPQPYTVQKTEYADETEMKIQGFHRYKF
jgi:hypothetical protein